MSRIQRSRFASSVVRAAVAITGVALLLLAADVPKARGQSADAPPIIVPDKVAYSPGETMVLTGSNWLPGETVTIVLCADSGSDGGTLDAVADESGAFTVTGAAPEERG